MDHRQDQPPSEGAVIVVELNGQQEKLLQDFVASDSRERSAEELIRYGFAEFAKQKRQQQS
jgi:hypothetical protein